jgi:hypothetical protein
MTKDVNIIRTAASIRKQLRSEIVVEGECDFSDVASIERVLRKIHPDFIVNSSRLYAGVKYGSISWSKFRAYGIWSPMAVLLGKNIMEAYERAGCDAVSINTSYSDVIIPWLKSAGSAFFDFGSGNLNHLIPRMKFYVAEKFRIENLNDIDITLVASHFHDVVISKEGHTEGVRLLLRIKYMDKELEVDQDDLFRACAIPMPVDQKRNMMNASSDFEIITGVISAIKEKKTVLLHIPGVDGYIGGYPYIIDGTGAEVTTRFADVFPLAEMESKNRESIYLDGIEDVKDGCIVYTDELLAKVKSSYHCDIPKTVSLKEADAIAQLLIERIIKPSVL